MKKRKGVIIIFVIIIIIMCNTLSYGNIIPMSYNVSVALNGVELDFTDEFGYPFIDNYQRTQIPFRIVMNAIGAEVGWDNDTFTALAVKEGVKIEVPVGKPYIIKNGIKIDSDTEAVIINGRIYLPLRIVLESFNYQVGFDAVKRQVLVTNTKQNPEEYSCVIENPFNTIHVGDLYSKFTQMYGKSDRIDVSKYDLNWHIYNSDYQKYIQVGVKNGAIKALYTNAPDWIYNANIKYGVSKEDIEGKMGKPLMKILKGHTNYIQYNYENEDSTFYFTYLKDSKYIKIYYNENIATAIMVVDYNTEQAMTSFYAAPSQELQNAFTKEIFDITNVERLKHGIEILQWNSVMASIAYNYSKDMTLREFFAHKDPDGKTMVDRAEDYGIKYLKIGENLAMGHTDAQEAVNGWMNSKTGHRENLLGEYDELGVGVYIANDGIPRYTQQFFTTMIQP